MKCVDRVVWAAAAVGLLQLVGCGGGGDGGASPADGCVAQAQALQLPGVGEIVALQLHNPGTRPLQLDLQGEVRFTGQAGAAAAQGGYSTLVLADGQSPVGVGELQAAAGQGAAGRVPFTVRVVVPAGASPTWRLVHQPLPAPYGWDAMQFSGGQICARAV